MSSRVTRQDFLRRAAMGGSMLAFPGLLAARAGAATKAPAAALRASGTLPKTIVFSNWPLYIDINNKKKTHPSLQQFEAHYHVNVQYIEDINDNDSFFGKIEGPLSQGQSVGRDLIVMTDTSGLPQRMIQLGWLEKIDKAAVPNIKNLQPAQRHPNWDPNREYSLPWQSGMTGIGYDPKKVGGTLDSVKELLTNPKFKGKVTLLTEMADTMGLVMLANGDDPAHVTNATWNRAVATIKKAVHSGQIRQFTGNDYAPLLAKGDVWACFAWSGDMVQLQADHPGLKWNLPSTGGMLWTDNMLIPKGGNAYAASVVMNWFYTPKVAAEVEDYVNYICPCAGADKVL
ncbi:MAG TPA: spermidine/putrescine ABC transporter substrate-binding protein, partial [Gaiellaceae bacterium]|nr:spermidine/putrescine ABC transporter substrate-binding protein [Gaiellaceae bacterium]